MDFVAIDLETANPDMASICQIGIARFESGSLKMEWKSYIDPQVYFDAVNVSIHGIHDGTVSGAPNLSLNCDNYFSAPSGQCDRHAYALRQDSPRIKHQLSTG